MKTMKNVNFAIFAIVQLMIMACTDITDNRLSQGAQIVGVKVNDVLYLPTNANNVATIVLAPGIDLSNAKVEVLALNGTIQDFNNKTQMDSRKPLTLTVNGDDGTVTPWTLKIQSPPLVSTFAIEGLTVNKADVHFGTSSLIVQVPKGTNLKALKATMDFVNGTVQDFTNGTVQDYTAPLTIHVLGVDGTTVYTYNFIITTESVGPAVIKSMTINGIATDSVVVTDATKNIVTPYVIGLSNFSSSTVTLVAGYGNIVDASFIGTGLNLLAGTATVKVTGSDGIQKTFTIGVPKLSLTPLLSMPYSSFGFGSDAGSSVALSGQYFVMANHNTGGVTPIGPNYYDLSGNRVNILSKTGTTIDNGAVTGIRKLASDDNGVILGVQLGAGAGATQVLNVYKWNSVTDAAPSVYISYSQTSLGFTYAPRAAGINIQGSLSGNAIITIPITGHTDVLVWTVTNGTLTSPTPTILSVIVSGIPGNYNSIQPMPVGTPGYVGAIVTASTNGIFNFTSTLTQISSQTGIVSTDCDVYAYKGRVYLAYTAYVSGSGARFRVCDITDGQANSFQTPIMDVLMPSTQSNGNATMDADLQVINSKLCVAFTCTNIGTRIYQLEN